MTNSRRTSRGPVSGHGPAVEKHWSKAQVCGRSPAQIVGSNPLGRMDVCCECYVVSGRDLCDEVITRPDESYRLRCAVCYLATSWMRTPWPTGGCRAKNKHYCENDDLPFAASLFTKFMRKWERLFVSGFEFNSPVSTATAFLNSGQKK